MEALLLAPMRRFRDRMTPQSLCLGYTLASKEPLRRSLLCYATWRVLNAAALFLPPIAAYEVYAYWACVGFVSAYAYSVLNFSVPARVEVVHDDGERDIRRIRLRGSPTVADVTAAARQWTCSPFTLKYTDKAGRWILVVHQNEWEECLSLWAQNPHDDLSLLLTETQAPVCVPVVQCESQAQTDGCSVPAACERQADVPVSPQCESPDTDAMTAYLPACEEQPSCASLSCEEAAPPSLCSGGDALRDSCNGSISSVEYDSDTESNGSAVIV